MAKKKNDGARSTENSGENSGAGKARGLANLKPFKPGQSGNPGGRPKGSGISKWYIPILSEINPKTRKEMAEKVARAHIERSMKNPSFANIVLDRTEGSVIQQHQIGGLEDLPQLITEGRKRAAEQAARRAASSEEPEPG